MSQLEIISVCPSYVAYYVVFACIISARLKKDFRKTKSINHEFMNVTKMYHDQYYINNVLDSLYIFNLYNLYLLDTIAGRLIE